LKEVKRLKELCERQRQIDDQLKAFDDKMAVLKQKVSNNILIKPEREGSQLYLVLYNSFEARSFRVPIACLPNLMKSIQFVLTQLEAGFSLESVKVAEEL